MNCSSSLSILGLDWETSSLVQSHTNHMQLEQAFAEAIHLVLDAQSTDQENGSRPSL
jgi:hypothetical protein